jgi:hypothetical protein
MQRTAVTAVISSFFKQIELEVIVWREMSYPINPDQSLPSEERSAVIHSS